jgi:hypothetical protein
VAEHKDWRDTMAQCAEQLQRRTGDDLTVWNQRVRESGVEDEPALREWLGARGVTGYGQMLLVMERFGSPDFLYATAGELIDAQYGDRPGLRPIGDRLIELGQAAGSEVTVQVRKTYVSLVGPRRTFAQIVPSTKTRVDLGLRLDGATPHGRLLGAKHLGNRVCSVRIELRDKAQADDEVVELLGRAYKANL